MKLFSKYKYWKHNYKQILKVFLLFFAILIASVPAILLLDKFFPQSDKSATFNLSYDGADIDFGTIDYFGIENKVFLKAYQDYYLDGQLFITDSSGLIEIEINDYDNHTFRLLFGGILYEFTFNDSITEDIVLATKSIDAMTYWDEVNLPAVWDKRTLIELDLLWSADGTSWVVIETITASLDGMNQFSNLIMSGYYALSESGDMYSTLNFTIDQDTVIYTSDIFIVPDKTIVDIDYLDTIFGADYSVDLSDIDWVILGRKVGGSEWQDISLDENWWLYFDISDIANGVITIYEILDKIIDTETAFYEYKIVIDNTWIMEQLLVLDTTTPIKLVAKSLDASVVWTYENEPAVGILMPLYYFDGTDYVFFENYLTDADGKIIIVELLPIGLYMLGETLFTITANDTIKAVECVIESIFWRREPCLDSIGDVEFKFFFFFVFKF